MSNVTHHHTIEWIEVSVVHLLWGICPLGIAFNIVGCIVLIRHYLQAGVYRTLVIALAVTDTLCLVVILASNIQLLVRSQCDTLLSTILTIIIHISFVLSLTVSAWITTLLSFTRFLSIRFPFWTSTQLTVRKIYVAIFVLVLVSMALNFKEFLYTISRVRKSDAEIDEGGMEAEDGEMVQFCHRLDISSLEQISPNIILLWLMLRSWIPIICVIVFNLLTLYHMRFNKRNKALRYGSKRSHGAASSIHSGDSKDNRRKARKVPALIFAVSFMFVISALPRSLSFVKLFVKSIRAGYVLKEWFYCYACHGVPTAIAVRLALLFETLNAALNFVLYLSFNREFRRDVIRYLFKGSRRQSGKSDITSASPITIQLTEVHFDPESRLSHNSSENSKLISENGL